MKISESIFLIEQELQANPSLVSMILSRQNVKTLIRSYREYEKMKAERTHWRTQAKYYEKAFEHAQAQLLRKENQDGQVIARRKIGSARNHQRAAEA